jgi:hypothetical protein
MQWIKPLAISDIFLTRLLLSDTRGLTRSQFKDTVKPLLAQHLSATELTAQIEQALTQLTQEGYAQAEGKARYQLTDLGHQYALVLLKLKTVPKNIKWDSLKNTYLLARVLDLPAFKGDKDRQRFAGADGLKAVILRLYFQLPIAAFPTLTQARNALLWKQFCDLTVIERLKIRQSELIQQPFNQGTVMTVLLNDLLFKDATEPGKPQSWEKALNLLVAKVIKAKQPKPYELRLALFQQAISQGLTPPDPDPQLQAQFNPQRLPPTDPTPPPVLELSTFAKTVFAAARQTQSGWFGDQKVFISHVWRTWQAQENGKALSLEQFKQHLAEANRRQLLTLSRADMAHALDSQDVTESETVHLQSTYHFVRVP